MESEVKTDADSGSQVKAGAGDVPEVPTTWNEKAFKKAYDQLKKDVRKETPENQNAVQAAQDLLDQLGPKGGLGKAIETLNTRLNEISEEKVDKGGVPNNGEHYFDKNFSRMVRSLTAEMEDLEKALESKMNKLTPYCRADDPKNKSSGDPWKDLNDLLTRADDLRKKAEKKEKEDKAKARKASVSGTGVKTSLTAFSASVTGVKAGVSMVSVSLVGTRLGLIGGKTGKDLRKATVCDAVQSAACGFETQLETTREAVTAMCSYVKIAKNDVENLKNAADGLLNSLNAVQIGGV